MSNLVKIKDVFLYTSTQLSANTTAACNAARDLLTSANVKFTELWYNDESVKESIPALTSLSTWNWGPGGSKGQTTFTDFPLVHWTECYDDWSSHQEHAAGVGELQSSNLLKNTQLVV